MRFENALNRLVRCSNARFREIPPCRVRTLRVFLLRRLIQFLHKEWPREQHHCIVSKQPGMQSGQAVHWAELRLQLGLLQHGVCLFGWEVPRAIDKLERLSDGLGRGYVKLETVITAVVGTGRRAVARRDGFAFIFFESLRLPAEKRSDQGIKNKEALPKLGVDSICLSLSCRTRRRPLHMIDAKHVCSPYRQS